MFRKTNFLSCFIIIGILIFFIVVSECIVRFLSDRHIVSYYKPIELVKQHETAEELRLSNVFSNGESEFEYDPLFFWRPKKNVGVFNTLGIRADSSGLQESVNTSCTVVMYGDSNTVGAFQGGYYDSPWPEELGKLLQKHIPDVRIFNMGVSGYSSYQGLEKFRQDIPFFHPSLVFVAFGWNDAAPNMGISDKEFHTMLSSLVSPLNNFRLFQVIKYYSDALLQRYIQKTVSDGPRVSSEDFKNNLVAFIQLAQQNNSTIVFITRPHTDFSDSEYSNWRVRVVENNAIIRSVAYEYGVPIIDMEEMFLNQYKNELIDDCHFTQRGHTIAAHEIYTLLQREQLSCGY
ncbi:MAG: SGNH/GDSL hydrolase family protein [Microgenomates group bacterium]